MPEREGEAAVVFVVPADGAPLIDPKALARFGLTRMETSVLELVAQGLTNREAGDRLALSIETVRSHLASAYRKTGVRNRAALVALAFGAPFGRPPVP
jgi:DNA-binding CsgD family transcriptional regulator